VWQQAVQPGISLQSDGSGRPVELSVRMTALGRPFALHLRADDLSGDDDWWRRETTWSSVMSPSVVVRVVGEGQDNVSVYRPFDGGITWYLGHDVYEIAPSSVLASTVEVNDTQVFRAVVRTTSNVYYVEPASDYPEV